ncbi:signal peptide peptidase SppA [Criibacterium bergeronii]|uniref:Signal peptide peptidase SppA n=1 Tax=Criibacterium bergeronii TaxID=1871336 RepID=A0A371INZ4_9FIRM|nr:signal peptide peptidase SppA [Criibacterium bergeronii]MBS6062459.1 signal peptide peptidase SppA [Peptostreptococcaceae bacterium]RDY22208.1 signal peptide peptidase SppA [Criibacterium bergeronii]TRW28710.1 signal peptide peptidase SppA [Criibacterium bergeronii]
MNAKRIVAIVIAVIVLFISLAVSAFKLSIKANEWTSLTSFDSANYGKEKVIEQGDDFSKIVVIDITGVIQAGRYQNEIMDSLEKVRNDEDVKGVILKIDSPGGGVYESAQISDKIKQIKSEKNIPFYASMGATCASGGYYIAANCDKIYASNETLTGSIGVIMSSLNLSGLFEKYGIKEDVIKSGTYKDIGSTSRQMTQSERQILQQMVDSSYAEFVKVVADGRKLSQDYVRSIADGRVYDGRQALEKKLIDKIGYYETTLEDIKKDNKLENSAVVNYNYRDSFNDLAQLFSGMAQNISKGSIQKDLESVKDATATPARPMYLYGGK